MRTKMYSVRYSVTAYSTAFNQGTTWQFHRYGINCKLSGSVYAVSEIEGAVPLIHEPAGCAFHQRLTPRKMYAPDSEIADTFRDLATAICENKDRVMPNPLSDDELDGINEEIEVLLKENEMED